MVFVGETGRLVKLLKEYLRNSLNIVQVNLNSNVSKRTYYDVWTTNTLIRLRIRAF